MISNLGFWPSGVWLKDGDKFLGAGSFYPPRKEGKDDEMAKNIFTGPICRYAQDLPLLAKIMSENRINFERKVDFHSIKIYYMEEFPGNLLKPVPDIRAAVRKAAKHFEETFNSKPIKITLPELEYALVIFLAKLLEAGMPSFRESIAGSGKDINLFLEFIKYFFGSSEHTLQAIYFAAIELREKDKNYYEFLAMFNTLKKKLDELLEGDALLLIPTHSEPAPHHFMTIPKLPNVAYSCILNVLRYPTTQIPAGLSDGLPIGIQAISSINNDYLTITAAIELEKAFGGWKTPSMIVA